MGLGLLLNTEFDGLFFVGLATHVDERFADP